MKDHGLGVDVIINDFEGNPRCTHGPTVLFERFHDNGVSRRYFACAACRDRRDCSFYHSLDQKLSEAKNEVWQSMIRSAAPKCSHKVVYNRLKEIREVPAMQRAYCLTCSTLLGSKKSGHSSCTLKSPIFDSQLSQPSAFLPPKESSRFEAQYMFTSNSVEVITGMLSQIDAKKVLCVGTPRIFEAINSSPEKKMSALLMDIDDRYGTFFSPLLYLRYNMFNHHFFGGDQSKEVYRQFITGSDKLVIVSDPPFGGRMELLAHNLLTIQKEWRNANKLPEEEMLSVLFIFPYFMEPQVLEQLPNFMMLDYQVDYDNHPLYSSGTKGLINGSAVRVFVNDQPSLFVLPANKGYRLCQPCGRWVRTTNTHCEKCKGCMSKDGRTYKHCDSCKKCVKPSWVHCGKCHKCQPQDHKCGDADPTSKNFVCHSCGKEGHKRMDCPNRKRSLSLSDHATKNKKCKIESNTRGSVSNPDVSGKKKKKNKNKKRNVSTRSEKNELENMGDVKNAVVAKKVLGKKAKVNTDLPKNLAVTQKKKNNAITKVNTDLPKNQAVTQKKKNNTITKVNTDFPKNQAVTQKKKNISVNKINSNRVAVKKNKKLSVEDKKEPLKENVLKNKGKKNKKGKNLL